MEEYVVFTDESSITASRYQSISSCSFPVIYYKHLSNHVKEILTRCDVKEFKWSKLKSYNYFLCAKAIIDLVITSIYHYQLRVDTIIWDTQDSRHTVRRRDDISNFERMFFHLLESSMKEREKGCVWHIRPDERSGIDWETIQDCLWNIGKRRDFERTLLGNFFTDPYFTVKSFKEKGSYEERLIQIPDLFSGLAVFSRGNFDKYRAWKNKEQLNLFSLLDMEEQEEDLTNKTEYMSRILGYLYKNCKERKIGVSLDSTGYLCTYKSSYPLNFWNYKPQGGYDKAPSKGDT